MSRNVVSSIPVFMNIAYFADITSIHNYKWIEYFAGANKVVILCDDNTPLEYLKTDNPNINIFPVLPCAYPLKKIRTRIKALKVIRQIISDNEIDIIHSMYVVPYSFWAYKLGFKNHIVTTRGSDILIDYSKKFKSAVGVNNRINGFLLKRTVEKALNEAIFITSTSKSQQKVIASFIRDSRKLYLIRTGVNVDDFLLTYDKLTRKGKAITVLSNRSMAPLYNIDVIIDAFVIVKSKLNFKKLQLVLINHHSSREYCDKILDKIETLGIAENVKILKEQTAVELMQTYKDSDVVVMVPSSDGTPVSGIETMLAKKPLIIGSLDYDEDIYNKDTVWKLPEISAVILANEIIKVLGFSNKDIERKTNKAFESAVSYADIKGEVKKVEELYKKMLEAIQ